MRCWWQIMLLIIGGLAWPVVASAQTTGQTQATVGFYADKTHTTVDRDSVQGTIPDGTRPYWQSPRRLAATRDPVHHQTWRQAWQVTQRTGRLPQTSDAVSLLVTVSGMLGLVAVVLLWLVIKTSRRRSTP